MHRVTAGGEPAGVERGQTALETLGRTRRVWDRADNRREVEEAGPTASNALAEARASLSRAMRQLDIIDSATLNTERVRDRCAFDLGNVARALAATASTLAAIRL